ncbi:alpha/beta hydrolase [Segetibacter aerophilus]|nr:alpha/beta hydrolase [Segetibacter aerophilus]
MKFTKYLSCLIAFIMTVTCTMNAVSQTIIPLYKDSIPNSKPTADEEKSEISKDSILIVSKVSRPTLSIYLPPKEKRTGAAVIICPGGGYWILAAGHEGADVARRFNEMGVAAFVLKYRIPNDKTMVNKEIGPLQDAQRAIQVVRENAKAWGINKNTVGIMGFSAGGHLASTAGTHFQRSYIANPKKTNLRPDFMVLAYPVISFTDSIGHTGSADQLLGKKASAEKIKEYSNELQVTTQTPPTFLVHAKDDGVKVENSLSFAAALKKHNVPAELYLYEKGGHGYGMYNKTSSVRWMDLVEEWMKKMKFIKKQ